MTVDRATPKLAPRAPSLMDTLLDGLFTGMIGALAVALWFLILDAAAGRPLPELKSGDLVAILSAGAYGAVMASDYNARPRVAEVLVHGEQWGIVRPRETYADLIAKDHIPDWLAG